MLSDDSDKIEHLQDIQMYAYTLKHVTSKTPAGVVELKKIIAMTHE
jgi:hypothetical protein